MNRHLAIRTARWLFSMMFISALPEASAQGTPQNEPGPPQSAEMPAAGSEPTGGSEEVAGVVEGEIPTIIVTGTRIKQKADFTFSNPVVSVGFEAIANSGTTSLTDFLKDIPALTASVGSNAASGSNNYIGVGQTGLELLNLRNLGVDRTLVLVNGRRHVGASPGTSAVDIDTIPLALIEDVQILTGGASAIYGADGVSGVVNFITKKDFEGLETKVQLGQSGHGDGRGVLASIVGGKNFADKQGNIAAAFEYSNEDRVKASKRSWTTRRGRVNFVDNPNVGADGISRAPLHDIRFTSARGGAVFLNGPSFLDDDGVPDFNGNDTPWDAGVPITPYTYQQGGDGTPLADYIGDLTPDKERYTVNTYLSYQLIDAARLFGELKYSQSKARSRSQPSFDFALLVQPDYAYMPPNIAAAAVAAETDGVVYVDRDNFDLGVRAEDIQRDTYRSVLGLDGDIWNGVHYEVSVVYGETNVRNRSTNNRYNDRFSAALDAVIDPATGQATCRSNLDPAAAPANLSYQQDFVGAYSVFDPRPGTWAGSFDPGPNSGCVPINIFGDGSISSAAAQWINVDSLATSRLQQTVVQAVISGDTVNWLVPGGSPMGYAIGLERRIEKSEGHPAVEDQRGLTFGNQILPDKGEYSVSEAFLELNVPLIEGQKYAEYLGMDGAIRLSNYSTIGATKTWKAGGSWKPVSDLTFRGTWAKATRAPNISELFSPQSQTFNPITDPCDAGNLDLGTGFRRANCAALLSSLGVADPANYTDINTASVAGLQKGNADLSEEDATTDTWGIVLQPRFAPGLSIAIDQYRIRLENAVSFPAPQGATDLCVDSPSLSNPFCDLIARESGTGRIVSFVQQPVNVSRFTTKGYDLTLNYRLNPRDLGVTGDIGGFNIRLIANRLEDLTLISQPGAVPDQKAGEGERPFERKENDVGQAPKWQANLDITWKYERLSVNYGLNYFDKTQRYTTEERAGDPNIVSPRFFNYDAKLTHDVYASYQLLDDVSVYAGVDNFTDEEPATGEIAYPVDPIGPFFYTGLEIKAF